jgi:hypothetical protein
MHSQGYKLQIGFYNRGLYQIGGFFIRCYLMRGDFDGLLKWLLQAKMKLTLLNQQPQGRRHDYELNNY